ncbi:E3 ubiquitin-protein ligase RNF25, partial [Mustelus asterias]
KGKEILTNNNIPQCQCVICLDFFQDDESFTKTACYHYFHSYCLARYIRHSEAELREQGEQQQTHKSPDRETELGVLCPVCREPLTYDLGLLLCADAPCQPLEPYEPDEASLQKQVELQDIFQRQLARGGIIDPEAERNRFFISLTRPVSRQEPEEELEGGADRSLPPRPDPETQPATSQERQSGRSARRGPLPSRGWHCPRHFARAPARGGAPCPSPRDHPGQSPGPRVGRDCQTP